MPLEFTDQMPALPRGQAKSASARQAEHDQVLKELKADAKAGHKGNEDLAQGTVASRWAILERKARSPEKWFALREREVEVRVVNDGTAPSMRDASQHVVVSTIWGRYVKGYVYSRRAGTAQ